MLELKQKPNGVYYLDTQVPDDKGGLRRARVGLGTKDKETAQAQRRDWIAGIHPKHPAQGGVIAPKGSPAHRKGSTKMKLDGNNAQRWLHRCLAEDDVWGKARAYATHKSNVKKLCQHLPDDLDIGQVNTTTIRDLRKSLEQEDLAPASVHKFLTAMSAACRYAVKQGMLAAMPDFEMPSYDNKRERTLTIDEQMALLDCFRERRRAEPMRHWWSMQKLVELLIETGCRKTEMLLSGPSWVKRKRWVDPMTGEYVEGVFLGIPKRTIYKGRETLVTKNGKPRDVPLSHRGQELVAELTERAEDARFFPWAIGTSAPTYFLQNIREDMKVRGYNIDDVVLHTLRHTCATRLAEGGMDLVGLRDWLGHSDINVTAERYIHLMNSHVHRGVAILDAYGSGTIGAANRKRMESSGQFSNGEARLGGSNRDMHGTTSH